MPKAKPQRKYAKRSDRRQGARERQRGKRAGHGGFFGFLRRLFGRK